MAVRPKPYKLVCPKCGYSKIVAPKSDCLTGEDLLAMNPVCKNVEIKWKEIIFMKIMVYKEIILIREILF